MTEISYKVDSSPLQLAGRLFATVSSHRKHLFTICNPALKAKAEQLEFSCPDDKHTYYTLPLCMRRDSDSFILMVCKTGQFFTSRQLLESPMHIFIHSHDLKESNTWTLTGLHTHLLNTTNSSFTVKALVTSNLHNIALSQMKTSCPKGSSNQKRIKFSSKPPPLGAPASAVCP